MDYIDLNVGNKIVKIRKWKVKDRENFKKDLLKNKDSAEKVAKVTLDNLVYNCLDKEYALNPDEIQYVFNNIRINSISDEVEFKYICKNCNKQESQIVKISEIHKGHFYNEDKIEVKNITILLQDVKNVKMYNDTIFKSETPWIDDLIYHIKSFNGDESMSFQKLKDLFLDLDVDILDEIMDKYDDIRFKLDKEYDVICPECGNTHTYIFDEIPDFLPQKWLSR
jgi:putative baseplate hub subunit protein